MTKENFVKKISNAGLKNTKYRVKIIQMISESKSLLSAQDIYQSLIKGKNNINLSTVYRTLDKLVETKIINRINFEKENQSLYEYNNNLHHHFLICKSCNKVIPIYSCPLENYEKKIENNYNFEILEHHVEFYGLCENCKEKLQKN